MVLLMGFNSRLPHSREDPRVLPRIAEYLWVSEETRAGIDANSCVGLSSDNFGSVGKL